MVNISIFDMTVLLLFIHQIITVLNNSRNFIEKQDIDCPRRSLVVMYFICLPSSKGGTANQATLCHNTSAGSKKGVIREEEYVSD